MPDAQPSAQPEGQRGALPGAQLMPAAWTRDLTVRIHADAATVFALLADVERWPRIFDHVNTVRIVKQMGARRRAIASLLRCSNQRGLSRDRSHPGLRGSVW